MPTPTSIQTSTNGVGGAGMTYETTEYIRNGNNNYTGIIMSTAAVANNSSPSSTVKHSYISKKSTIELERRGRVN